MRKCFITLSITALTIVTFFVVLPADLYAACNAVPTDPCGGDTPNECIVGATRFCCTEAGECEAAPPSPQGAGGCDDNSIYTGIGCIPLFGSDDGTPFIAFVLRWAIGIAGGIALLLIVYAGVQILTSSGDPKKVQAGKQLLTAAVGGFVFLLMAAFLLRFIGVEILEIPDF